MHERPQGDLVDAVTSAGIESSAVIRAPRKDTSDLFFSSSVAAPKFLTLPAGASVAYKGKQGCLPLEVAGCSLQVSGTM